MRVYLEAIETGAGLEDEEFVRLDVTAKSQAERDAILVSLKDYMTGVTSTFTRHTCYHLERQSCVSEPV